MDDHAGMGFFIGAIMDERFKKIDTGQGKIQDCDYCFKTDVDFVRETGSLGIWWEDTKYGLRACDDCKKHEDRICIEGT